MLEEALEAERVLIDEQVEETFSPPSSSSHVQDEVFNVLSGIIDTVENKVTTRVSGTRNRAHPLSAVDLTDVCTTCTVRSCASLIQRG